MLEVFFLLICAHYLADFPLQGDFIAQNKGKVFFESIGFHCLTAHAAIQALSVWAVTQSAPAALTVGITHWALDFCKSWKGFEGPRFALTKGARMGPQTYGLWGINVDQAMHVAVLAGVAIAVS